MSRESEIDEKQREWLESPLYLFIQESGLQYNRALVNRLRRAFVVGHIEPTLEAAKLIALGRIHVWDVGATKQLALCGALIEWYKQKAEACDNA